MDRPADTRSPSRRAPSAGKVAAALACALVLSASILTLLHMDEGTLDDVQYLQFFPVDTDVQIVALAVFTFVAAFACVLGVLTCATGWVRRRASVPERRRRLALTFDRRGVATASVVCLVLWIPVIAVSYPGTADSFDTVNQLYQFFTPEPTYYTAMFEVVDASYVDHHPVFDTILFGVFVAFGRMLGSDGLGMLLYGIVQSAATAFVLCLSVCYLQRLKAPWGLRLASFLFVVFFPVIPFSADAMQKDSVFGVFFMGYALCYVEAFRSKGEALKKPWFMALFMALAVLSSVSKKTGMYVVLAAGLVMVAALRGARLRSLVSCAMPVLMAAVLLPAFFNPLLNIEEGGSQEMFGVLYHQTVTVLKYAPDDVGDEELAAIEAVLDTEAALEDYQVHLTDGVKRHQRDGFTTSEFVDYLVVYVRQGLRHPLLYAKSVYGHTAPLLIPSVPLDFVKGIEQRHIDTFVEYAAQLGFDFDLDLVQPEATRAVVEAVGDFFEVDFSRLPFVSLLYTQGLYGFWLPFTALVLVVASRRRCAWALTPVLLNTVLLLICPGYLPRYVLFSVYSVPLLLGCVTWAMTEDAEPPSLPTKARPTRRKAHRA